MSTNISFFLESLTDLSTAFEPIVFGVMKLNFPKGESDEETES